MDGHRQSAEPDILIHEDDGFTVEVSVPVGKRERRFLTFEAEDRQDAEGLAQSLLRRAQRPCEGDALDAVLGVGLFNEGGPR